MLASGGQKTTLDGIQYLRAIAAMMVVFHHTRLEFDGAASIVFGARGVDLFFVISGFVMMAATRDKWPAPHSPLRLRWAATWDFWKRRVLRIVPLYWLSVLMFDVMVHDVVSPSLALDLVFIPHVSPTHPPYIWPALIPGWSLNAEMFFYLLFGLSFLVGRAGIWLVCAGIAALVAANALGVSAAVPVRFYGAPVMLCFVAGVVLHAGFARWSEHRRLPSKGVFAAVFVGALVLMMVLPRSAWLVVTAPVCLLIVGSATVLFQGWKIPLLGLLGDASYSIYLSHISSYALTRPLLEALGVTVQDRWGVLLAFAIYQAVACLLGLALYYLAERPMTRLLGRSPKGTGAGAQPVVAG